MTEVRCSPAKAARHRFVFEGFLPRSGAGRTAVLAALAGEQRTSVIFSSPRRIGSDLGDLEAKLGGDRRVVVVRELTKLHEEVWRGTLEEAASRWADGTKGEVTLVVEGADEPVPDLDAALEEVGTVGHRRSEPVGGGPPGCRHPQRFSSAAVRDGNPPEARRQARGRGLGGQGAAGQM